MEQHRHAAARAVVLELLVGGGGIERDQDLLEFDAHVLHEQPGPQRPRGIILVADDERELRH